MNETVTMIFGLIGGLALFLFGMNNMSSSLQKVAGDRMKKVLGFLTRNPLLGAVAGALVTAVLQSSSATTVMVIGFVSAGLMSLPQAISVIFGANIGTTITSILIALDVSGIAPFCIFVGAFLMLYSKKKQTKHIGQVILGFGLLFQGLHTMSGAMKPLKDVIWFQEFIMNAKSPLLGLLVGAALCAVIQSSSAAVGILQALAMQGLMPLYFASFLVCGINIGSAMPTILASMNARNNAKRASMIYLINNLVGAVIMTVVTLALPYTQFIEGLIPDPMFQVSLVHIIFKVVSAAVLLPLTNQVVKLTYLMVPKQKHEDACRLEFIDVNLVGSPSVTLLQIRNEVERMAGLVRTNLQLSMEALLSGKVADAKQIEDNEAVIDYLTDAISDFLVKLNVREMSDRDAQYVNRVFQTLSDLERIGDYAEQLLHLTERQEEKQVSYSAAAMQELTVINDNAIQLFDKAVAAFYRQNISLDELKRMAKTQRNIRKLTSQSQLNHMERLRSGECGVEAGILFGEILNSLSRVGGHAINIAEAATVPHGME